MSVRHFTKVAFASLTLSLFSLHAGAEALLDQAAPLFTAKAADGSSIDLASYKGKKVVLEWTNHQCPYVVKHYDKSGNIPKLQQEAVADGIVWLQVISSVEGKQGYVDGSKAIQLNKERNATPTNTILDPSGEIGKLYAAQTSPHFFIIDEAGVLVYKGGVDSIKSNKAEDIPKATNYVREALAALAAGQKVPNPSTTPYGCSIKYAS